MPKGMTRTYRTITGRRILLTKIGKAEKKFLLLIRRQYKLRPEWTRFAEWWNVQLSGAGLSSTSVIYRVCQDLEARLGIAQGKVAPPDYRDFLADLVESQFGSRQEFCRATGVDAGQLSRVFAGRADLSLSALQKVLGVLGAHLVVQTDEESRERISVDRAEEELALASR